MFTVMTPTSMGIQNEKTIFRFIHEEGPVSKSHIARRTGLSKPAVSSSVQRLLARNLVLEASPVNYNKVGRKPILIDVNPAAANFLVYDIGGTKIAIGLTNLRGHIVMESIIKTPHSWEKLVDVLAGYITDAELRWGIPSDRIKGVVLGVPGVVDSNGTVSFAPNIDGDKAFPLQQELQERIPVPVFVENDVNLAALGEFLMRKKQPTSLCYLAIGTGVGAGVIIDGALYRGGHRRAGEVGWLVADVKGLSGAARETEGYLESMMSGPSLVRQAREALNTKPNDSLISSLEKLDLGLVVSAYGRSQVARDVIDNWLDRIALVICNVAAMLDPDIVVLGGGVADLARDFVQRIRELVVANTQIPPDIEMSICQQRAGIYGGIELCQNNIDSLVWGDAGR